MKANAHYPHFPMRWHTHGIIVAVSLLAALVGHRSARAEWTNVTHDVGDDKWGYAGVCLLAAVPDSVAVIAGVSEAGLWRSDDLGTSWRKLAPQDQEPIRNRPHQIVFDPAVAYLQVVDEAIVWRIRERPRQGNLDHGVRLRRLHRRGLETGLWRSVDFSRRH